MIDCLQRFYCLDNIQLTIYTKDFMRSGDLLREKVGECQCKTEVLCYKALAYYILEGLCVESECV